MKSAIWALSAALLASAMLASLVPAILHFVAVDVCLDRGLVYDYDARSCRGDIVSFQVPPPHENLDYATSAFGFLLVVATASIVAVLTAAPLRKFLRLRRVVRWAGAALLLGYALIALNNAAASAWLSDGPPTPNPAAWWGQAVGSFWISVASFLTAIWFIIALKSKSKDREPDIDPIVPRPTVP